MDYIGSKLSLLSFLQQSILAVAGKDFLSFYDLFSGTAAVGIHFKKMGYQVASNDIQYYSYVLARHYIQNSSPMEFEGIKAELGEGYGDFLADAYSNVCHYLNNLPGLEGFIYQNYCPGGTRDNEFQRSYFTDENGKLCDHIRTQIEAWHTDGMVSDDEYYCLLATLLESIDKYSNTASVYGAFLKKIKKTAARKFVFSPLAIYLSNKANKAYNQDINTLIEGISGDVLYLDPPYNHRQYAANYHILETIVRYDNPPIRGLTGLRDYKEEKSDWCVKRKVCEQFDYLIQHADFKYIFLSYNNEGLMSLDQIKEIMSKKGKYGHFEYKYSRFKADRDENRAYKSNHTIEYLHYLIVDK